MKAVACFPVTAGAQRDRKSTRLNSSHSLHLPLPICSPRQVANFIKLWSASREMVELSRDEGGCVLPGNGRGAERSEEHTSELQSLSPPPSPDLFASPSREFHQIVVGKPRDG